MPNGFYDAGIPLSHWAQWVILAVFVTVALFAIAVMRWHLHVQSRRDGRRWELRYARDRGADEAWSDPAGRREAFKAALLVAFENGDLLEAVTVSASAVNEAMFAVSRSTTSAVRSLRTALAALEGEHA